MAILGKIQEFVAKIVYAAFNFVYNLATGEKWWLALIILVVAALLVIIGLIALIAKTWKVLLVLVVLGGIGFAVYYFVIRGKAPQTTVTPEVVNSFFGIAKAYLPF